MFPWECEAEGQFLTGSLIVSAVHVGTDEPVPGFWVGVADAPEVAAGRG
jgi:hypothetical protein